MISLKAMFPTKLFQSESQPIVQSENFLIEKKGKKMGRKQNCFLHFSQNGAANHFSHSQYTLSMADTVNNTVKTWRTRFGKENESTVSSPALSKGRVLQKEEGRRRRRRREEEEEVSEVSEVSGGENQLTTKTRATEERELRM